MQRKRSSWFRSIFTGAFLLFLSIIKIELNQINLSKAIVKIRRNPLRRFLFMIQNFLHVLLVDNKTNNAMDRSNLQVQITRRASTLKHVDFKKVI